LGDDAFFCRYDTLNDQGLLGWNAHKSGHVFDDNTFLRFISRKPESRSLGANPAMAAYARVCGLTTAAVVRPAMRSNRSHPEG